MKKTLFSLFLATILTATFTSCVTFSYTTSETITSVSNKLEKGKSFAIITDASNALMAAKIKSNLITYASNIEIVNAPAIPENYDYLVKAILIKNGEFTMNAKIQITDPAGTILDEATLKSEGAVISTNPAEYVELMATPISNYITSLF